MQLLYSLDGILLSWDIRGEEKNDQDNKITSLMYSFLIYTPFIINEIWEYQKYTS